MESLYSIISKNEIDDKWKFVVMFNSNHSIFKGHFPELPIVPGAVLVQMVRELVESIVQKKIKLRAAGSIKFLKMILPNNTANVEIMIVITNVDDIKVIAEFRIDAILYCKMNTTY